MSAHRKTKPAGRKRAKRAAPAKAASVRAARSPLAPKTFAKLPPLAGVRLATGAAGIRYRDRDDVLLVALAPGTTVAGVFTRSKVPSAPVEWCRANLAGGIARALVVNSGNANAFTGKAGMDAAMAVADAAAAALGCDAREVFLASTGVIGEPLPKDKIVRLIPKLAHSGSAEGWRAAAEAIVTTDTYPKLATASAEIDGRKVTINGIAKGSGMIAPNMATLLAFVFTDAALPAAALQALLADGVKRSFNCITVDGDTSTSDTVLAFATGKGARHAAIGNANDKRLGDFRRALDRVLLDLALQAVRDGEGATKLIAVDVTGAVSDESARKVALAIANSPLVKTAIAGGDANWGRVVMAVGKAGEPADRDKLRIWFSSPVYGGGGPRAQRAVEGGTREARESVFAKKAILVAENGARAANHDERAAARAVKGPEVHIAADLGLGRGAARAYTCDLTEGYIRINAGYRS